MLFPWKRFAHKDLLKSAAAALLALFLIPLLSWAFTGYVQRTADAKALMALEQETLQNSRLSDSQRHERLTFYRQITPSKVCGRSEPGLAAYRASTCAPLSDLWQFHVVHQVSFWALALSGTALAMALGLAGCVRMRPRLQQPVFVLGGWLGGGVGAVQLLVQAGLVAWLCFWLPVYFLEIYLFKWLVVVGLCVAAAGVIYTALAVRRFEIGVYRVAGERVDEAQAPLLWAHVRQTAAQLNTAAPDQIVAGIDTHFFVAQAPLRLGRQTLQGRTLFISLALLRLLSRREADAVLAHELAHFAGEKDTRRAQLGNRLHHYNQYCQQMRHLRPALGTFCILRGWQSLFQAAAQRTTRAREVAADLAAAKLVSPGSLVRALIKMASYAHYRKQTKSALFARNHQADGRLNFEYAVASGFVGHMQSAHFIKTMRTAPIPHPFDAHASLRQRMTTVGVTVPSSRYAAEAGRKPTDTWVHDIPQAVDIEQRLWAAYEQKMVEADQHASSRRPRAAGDPAARTGRPRALAAP